MKPLHLSIEGFMAFRDRVELDFTDKALFVLMGPTGSGKSSVLDAIAFALFGETPRMGPRDLKKLLHHNVENPRLNAHVSYAFRHYGQDYRISRQLSASKHQVELEHRAHPEAEWEVHSTGNLSFFKQEIPRLLGLDFEAFKKVILLPQGGFDQFLKQDGPGERRKFLMHLARLEIYDKIRDQADIQLRQLREERARLTGSLESLGALSGEELAELKAKLKEQREQWQQAQSRSEASQKQGEAAEALWEKLQALEDNAREQAELEARQSEMEALEQRLKQGRWLESKAAELDYLQRGAHKLQALSQERQQVETQWQAWQAQQAELQAEAEALAQAESQREAQTERLQQLQALEPDLERWQNLHGRLQKLRQQLAKRQAEAQKSAQEATQAQTRLPQLQAERQALEAQQKELHVDPERLESLQELGPELRQLQATLMPELQHKEQEATESKAKLRQEAEKITALKAEIEQAEQQLQSAQHQLVEAEQALQNARLTHQAEDLRHQLQVGQTCPVCQQEVHSLPTPAQTTALARGQSQWEQAKQELQKAEKHVHTLQQQDTQLVTLYRSGREQYAALGQQIQSARQDCQTRERALLDRLQRSTLPDWQELKQEFEALKAQARQQKELEEQSHQLQKTEQDCQHRLQLAQEQKRLLEQTCAELENEVQHTATEQADLQSRLQTLLGTQAGLGSEVDYASSLKTELKTLKEQLQASQNQRESWQARQQEQEQLRVRLDTRLQDLRQREQEQSTEQAELEVRLLQAVQEQGLPDLTAARAALPQAGELARWESQIQQHQGQLQALLREALKLQAVIQGQKLSAAELEALRQSQQEDKAQTEQLQQAVLLGEQRLQAQQELQKRAWQLHEEKAQVQERYERYERIHTDLGTRHLPDFLAKRVMERVIEGGSRELLQLSHQRYSFFLDESEELVILDAWNALEPRSVKTLSGGESFLASLSLALALHDYLSAGVQLDSLFIDEGFGTLDSESLELAAEVIEQLQVEGKCIGVITHIPELAERFEHRVQVIKAETGAQLVPD